MQLNIQKRTQRHDKFKSVRKYLRLRNIVAVWLDAVSVAAANNKLINFNLSKLWCEQEAHQLEGRNETLQQSTWKWLRVFCGTLVFIWRQTPGELFNPMLVRTVFALLCRAFSGILQSPWSKTKLSLSSYSRSPLRVEKHTTVNRLCGLLFEYKARRNSLLDNTLLFFLPARKWRTLNTFWAADAIA